MNFINKIIKALVLVYVTLFVIFNTETVKITMLPKVAVYTIPVFLPILIALFGGGIVVALGFFIENMRITKELKNIRKTLIHAEEENNRLRNLPLVQDSDIQNKDN